MAQEQVFFPYHVQNSTGSDELEATAKPPNGVRAIIRKLVESYVQAYNTQDVDTILSFYAPDAVFLPAYGTGVRGQDAIREYFHAMFPAERSSFVMDSEESSYTQDLAVDMGRYAVTVRTKNGRKVRDEGKYTLTWRRQSDGAFRLTAASWTSESNLSVEV